MAAINVSPTNAVSRIAMQNDVRVRRDRAAAIIIMDSVDFDKNQNNCVPGWSKINPARYTIMHTSVNLNQFISAEVLVF